MTARAIVVGLLGAIAIAAVTFLNDRVMMGTFLILHYLPVAVIGPLLAWVLIINPVLKRVSPRAAFRGPELAVSVGLMLAVCAIPGNGLLEHATNVLMLPHHFARIEPGWQGEDPVVARAPARLLADPSADPSRALDGFINGLGDGDRGVPLRELPWFAWTRTLGFWVPLVASLFAALAGLALVVHPQWSRHENLPYPTVAFIHALLPGEDGGASRLLRSRPFIVAAGLVIVLHMNNYLLAWYPNVLLEVQTRLPLWPLTNLVPILHRSTIHLGALFNPKIFFIVIGIAYFLPGDVSFSVGLAPYLFALVTAILSLYGVPMSAGLTMEPSIVILCYAGAFAGIAAVVLATGRRYYLCVLRRSLGLSAPDPVEPSAALGGRLFLSGLGLFVLLLCLAGLSPVFALPYALGLVIIHLTASRALAEGGVYYMHSFFFPCTVLWAFLGPLAVGPDSLLLMGIVSAVLSADPNASFMPFVLSGLKLSADTRVSLNRFTAWGALAVVLALAVAIPVTLSLQYRHGAIRAGDGWTRDYLPKNPFAASVAVRKHLAAQGRPVGRGPVSVTDRLRGIDPRGSCVAAFATTFLLVVLFTKLRHRFPGWPFHPLMFVVLATAQSCMIAFSFLLGWLVKALILRYGGAGVYNRWKPAMIGLIAGESLAGFVPVVVGALYYILTDRCPVPFSILR